MKNGQTKKIPHCFMGLFTVLLSLLIGLSAHAFTNIEPLPGPLDTTFGELLEGNSRSGRIIPPDMGRQHSRIYQLATQGLVGESKILVGGVSYPIDEDGLGITFLARLNPDGSPDREFGLDPESHIVEVCDTDISRAFATPAGFFATLNDEDTLVSLCTRSNGQQMIYQLSAFDENGRPTGDVWGLPDNSHQITFERDYALESLSVVQMHHYAHLGVEGIYFVLNRPGSGHQSVIIEHLSLVAGDEPVGFTEQPFSHLRFRTPAGVYSAEAPEGNYYEFEAQQVIVANELIPQIAGFERLVTRNGEELSFSEPRLVLKTVVGDEITTAAVGPFDDLRSSRLLATDITVQGDGKILVLAVGAFEVPYYGATINAFRSVLARFQEDGSVDTTLETGFGPLNQAGGARLGYVTTTQLIEAAIADDSFRWDRFPLPRALAESFIRQINDIGHAVSSSRLEGGLERILVGGGGNGPAYLARLLPNGNLDDEYAQVGLSMSGWTLNDFYSVLDDSTPIPDSFLTTDVLERDEQYIVGGYRYHQEDDGNSSVWFLEQQLENAEPLVTHADLLVENQTNSDGIVGGAEPFEYEASVTNHGPDEVTQVLISIGIPAEGLVSSAEVRDQSGDVVGDCLIVPNFDFALCEVPALSAGDTVTVTVAVEPVAESDVATALFGVDSAYNEDPTPENDEATVEAAFFSCGVGGNSAVVQAPEQCDDGNQINGDGCSARCLIEDGWECSGDSPSVCQEIESPQPGGGNAGSAGGGCSLIRVP